LVDLFDSGMLQLFEFELHHIKCVVNILQCAVVGPQVEIVVRVCSSAPRPSGSPPLTPVDRMYMRPSTTSRLTACRRRACPAE
jgi:hypothetical protein